MSTCLLSVVIDIGGSKPRLYQVLYLNPNVVSGPCSYHDGLSPLSSAIPSLTLPPTPPPDSSSIINASHEPAVLPVSHPSLPPLSSSSYPCPNFLPFCFGNYYHTTPFRTSDLASDLVSRLSRSSSSDESDDVFTEDLPCPLPKPPNLSPSPEVSRKFPEKEGEELRLKLLRQRMKLGEIEPVSVSSSKATSHTIARGLIPCISVAGVAAPYSSHNVQFAFDNVLEFWRSFEYVKVCSY